MPYLVISNILQNAQKHLTFFVNYAYRRTYVLCDII